jgi:hypothetical protein
MKYGVRIAGALLAIYGSSSAALADSGCNELNAVVNAAQDNFTSIMGAKDDDDPQLAMTAASTVTLPNANSCKIYLWSGELGNEFQCRWLFTDDRASRSAEQQIRHTVATCLKVTDDGHGSFTVHGVEISVGSHRSKRDGLYRVFLGVERPTTQKVGS